VISREELRASMYANGADEDTVNRLCPLPIKRVKRTGPTPEHLVKEEIVVYLNRHPRVGWFHVMRTGMADYNGRKVPFGSVGMPDIIGQMTDGRFLGIEVKAGKNTTSPAQEKFLQKIKRNNGVAIVAWSIDNLAGVLG